MAVRVKRKLIKISMFIEGFANNSSSTTDGIQYLVGSNPSGNFAAAAPNDIAQYSGAKSKWLFTKPDSMNLELFDINARMLYRYDHESSTWVALISFMDPNAIPSTDPRKLYDHVVMMVYVTDEPCDRFNPSNYDCVVKVPQESDEVSYGSYIMIQKDTNRFYKVDSNGTVKQLRYFFPNDANAIGNSATMHTSLHLLNRIDGKIYVYKWYDDKVKVPSTGTTLDSGSIVIESNGALTSTRDSMIPTAHIILYKDSGPVVLSRTPMMFRKDTVSPGNTWDTSFADTSGNKGLLMRRVAGSNILGGLSTSTNKSFCYPIDNELIIGNLTNEQIIHKKIVKTFAITDSNAPLFATGFNIDPTIRFSLGGLPMTPTKDYVYTIERSLNDSNEDIITLTIDWNNHALNTITLQESDRYSIMYPCRSTIARTMLNN